MTTTQTPLPDAEAWLSGFVMLAWRAEDDPAMCIELARTMRIVGDAMGIPERLREKARNRSAAS